jgi:DNA-binding XRE family transcriptional regulator
LVLAAGSKIGMIHGRKENDRAWVKSAISGLGEKLRARRLMMHVSQQDLAKVLGLPFQQIQKYEKGTNRMSAAMLFQNCGGTQGRRCVSL